MPAQPSTSELNKAIMEEYAIWKKNTPFLYDSVLTHALDYPSMTVEWLPEQLTSTDSQGIEYTTQRILFGTQTGYEAHEQNSILIAEIKLPNSSDDLAAAVNNANNDDSNDTMDTTSSSSAPNSSSSNHNSIASLTSSTRYGSSAGRLDIVQSINHSGEVNRARHMPQRSTIIATKSASADVYVFDAAWHMSSHSSKPQKYSSMNAQFKLTGHSDEGFALNWSPLKSGLLLSGSQDNQICSWDLQSNFKATSTQMTPSQSQQSTTVLPALHTYKYHTGKVEDVAWHPSTPTIFASTGADRTIAIWDQRSPSTSSKSSKNDKPTIICPNAHSGPINCISFNPVNVNLLLTGGEDGSCGLFDIRHMSQRLHSFEVHSEDVFSAQWSPHYESVFASSSSDRRVCVWDLQLIGKEQSGEDAEDGPPELIFLHGGHTDKVVDISWSKNEPMMIASVSEDAQLQCWQMADAIYETQDEQLDREQALEKQDLE